MCVQEEPTPSLPHPTRGSKYWVAAKRLRSGHSRMTKVVKIEYMGSAKRPWHRLQYHWSSSYPVLTFQGMPDQRQVMHGWRLQTPQTSPRGYWPYSIVHATTTLYPLSRGWTGRQPFHFMAMFGTNRTKISTTFGCYMTDFCSFHLEISHCDAPRAHSSSSRTTATNL